MQNSIKLKKLCLQEYHKMVSHLKLAQEWVYLSTVANVSVDFVYKGRFVKGYVSSTDVFSFIEYKILRSVF